MLGEDPEAARGRGRTRKGPSCQCFSSPALVGDRYQCAG